MTCRNDQNTISGVPVTRSHKSTLCASGLRAAAAFGAMAIAGCTTETVPPATTSQTVPPVVQHLNNIEPWPYPFSAAVRVGDLLYLAGQMGTRMEDGIVTLVPGGIEAETRQTMENIKAILAYAGSSMDRVVKCSVMMADMAEWPRMNTIYAEYFPGPKPARSAWGANGLAFNGRVEIECWAVAADSAQRRADR
jgi:reactive intermediate/imine deaminase